MGYYRAGFDVVGVDIEPQPHYPFRFYRADALTFSLEGFSAYHASPPCQFGSICTPSDRRSAHLNLIPAIREHLQSTGKPFVIENVEGSREHLKTCFMLCGTMVGLPIWRHRYFEVDPFCLALLPSCQHVFSPVVVSGQSKKRDANGKRKWVSVADRRTAMGIDWMTLDEIKQAIPPAYTEFIGKQLLALL